MVSGVVTRVFTPTHLLQVATAIAQRQCSVDQSHPLVYNAPDELAKAHSDTSLLLVTKAIR